METSDLNSPDYWESETVDLRVNPRRAPDTAGLREFLEVECGVKAAVVLASSGSSGRAKWIVLRKAALLASARAVNAHCGLTPDDVWLGGLSTFHVGGIGIHARAFCNGARVVPMAWDAWTRDGSAFLSSVESAGATLASLTPTHLWDLVRAGVGAPATLRIIFLGGGRIDPVLAERARELGWPLRATYGMTEASSQVATAMGGETEWLPLLPLWEAEAAADGSLRLRGEALCEGWAVKESDVWSFVRARDEQGWFTAGDRCEIRGRELRFLARADQSVKVSGELVSLAGLNARLESLGIIGLLVALPHPRAEHELILVCEEGAAGALERFNAGLPALERATGFVTVPMLPRTETGKPDRSKIEDLARGLA